MKILKKLVVLLGAAALCSGLYIFCEKQTQGFRPYLLLSNLPNDPRWEVSPLSAPEQTEVDALLDQRFTYLGAGGWSIAFLGEDQKTVLKFYRHNEFRPLFVLRDFSVTKLLLKNTPHPKDLPYFQEFNFNSCTLLYSKAKERTGLLYVHLNKTEGKHKPVTLVDPIGVHHTIDLDKTEFVVQKKADLLFPYLNRLAKQNKKEEAKQAINDLVYCLLTLYHNGIRDLDFSLRNNFGFIDGKAVTLDLSSFAYDETIKRPGVYKKEVVIKTQPLSRFLRKQHPDLFPYYQDLLAELIEDTEN